MRGSPRHLNSIELGGVLGADCLALRLSATSGASTPREPLVLKQRDVRVVEEATLGKRIWRAALTDAETSLTQSIERLPAVLM